MEEIRLSRRDYLHFETDNALIIVDELNRQISDMLNDPLQPLPSISAIKNLKKDMIAAPQLYLSQDTLARLNLPDFEEY